MSTDSATRPPSQQSVKAFVEGLTGTNIVATGALNAGSITSGFGNINNGASTITTTGAISVGSATIPQVTASSSSNSVAWNALTSPNIQHTTSENTTIAAPSNGVSGQFISILIIDN